VPGAEIAVVWVALIFPRGRADACLALLLASLQDLVTHDADWAFQHKLAKLGPPKAPSSCVSMWYPVPVASSGLRAEVGVHMLALIVARYRVVWTLDLASALFLPPEAIERLDGRRPSAVSRGITTSACTALRSGSGELQLSQYIGLGRAFVSCVSMSRAKTFRPSQTEHLRGEVGLTL
jgi:hypothetical protein